jgi:hypothetical protein
MVLLTYCGSIVIHVRVETMAVTFKWVSFSMMRLCDDMRHLTDFSLLKDFLENVHVRVVL